MTSSNISKGIYQHHPEVKKFQAKPMPIYLFCLFHYKSVAEFKNVGNNFTTLTKMTRKLSTTDRKKSTHWPLTVITIIIKTEDITGLHRYFLSLSSEAL